MKGFGKKGIHPNENKLTANSPIIDVALPLTVTLQMNQSLGKPAKPVVKAGDHVTRYQVVGEADGPISANIHSPISGTVKSVGSAPVANGQYAACITIAADNDDHNADLMSISDATPVRTLEQALAATPEEIEAIIRDTGIVGLGGATFPTAFKISSSRSAGVDTLLINGAECEPYLTCDNAIMNEMTEEILQGIEILRHAYGARRAIIGIEANKPDAIKKIRQLSHGRCEVVELRTRYPQGGEKMLTKALSGKEIAPGKLPASVGVAIQNVATALAVYHAVIWGIPLVERTLTISGDKIPEGARGNFRVPIGTPLSSIIKADDQTVSDATKIIAGGPMMGVSLPAIQGFTHKGMSGLLFLDSKIKKSEPCVRCGRCVDACPMGLEPFLIARMSETGYIEDARDNHIMDCMECGCCSYVCISSRRLVDWIRVGKRRVREL